MATVGADPEEGGVQTSRPAPPASERGFCFCAPLACNPCGDCRRALFGLECVGVLGLAEADPEEGGVQTSRLPPPGVGGSFSFCAPFACNPFGDCRRASHKNKSARL